MIGSLTKEALAKVANLTDASEATGVFAGSAEFAGLDAAFDVFVRSPRATGADWVKELRLKAFGRFTELGLPTRKQEEWKYTHFRGLGDEPWANETSANSGQSAGGKIDAALLTTIQAKIYPEELSLVFIDGVLSTAMSRLSNLPKGLKITPIGEVLGAAASSLKSKLIAAAAAATVFESLNLAFLETGLLIEAERNAKVEPVIHVLHVTTANAALRAPRHAIFLAEGAEATVIETYLTPEAGGASRPSLTAAVTEIELAANASLRHVQIQIDGPAAFSVSTTRANVGRDARYHSFKFAAAGRVSRADLTVSLSGVNAQATLDGLYLGAGKGHVDHHTVVDHRLPNTTSAQLYKGVLKDHARAVFNGKVFVREGAQQTNAGQLNRNLLLSSDSEVDTKPQLEIDADDVKCSHGASVGPLNQDEIFYLTSRAISEAEAIRMLSVGFADEVIFRLPLPAHRDELRRLAREILTHA